MQASARTPATLWSGSTLMMLGAAIRPRSRIAPPVANLMRMAIEGHIYISELAAHLGRAEHTLRQWVKRDDFPHHLRPQVEGGRKRLYWQSHQIAGLERYAAQRSSARGSFGRERAAQASARVS